MIYLVTRRHRYTIDAYLDSRHGESMHDRFRILPYEDLAYCQHLPLGTYVFSDHERYSPNLLELASTVWTQLEAAGPRVRLLNRPGVAMPRYELLRTMYDKGINRFQARRASENLDGLRYPVFVREEHDHSGSLTDLIPDPASLKRCLRRLTFLRGRRRAEELLVVEFCDTSDENGFFRKLSIVRIADRLFPRYLDRGRHWMVKGHTSDVDEDSLEEERRFLSENPHEDWAREIFEMTGIEYGRMDYGVIEGQPQVWEINTNPRIGPSPRTWKKLGPPISEEFRARRRQFRESFHSGFRAVVEGIDLPSEDAEEQPIEIDPDLVRRLARDERRARRRDLARRVRRRLKMVVSRA